MSGENEQFGRSGADKPVKIGQFQWNQTDADGRSYDLSTTLETLNENNTLGWQRYTLVCIWLCCKSP